MQQPQGQQPNRVKKFGQNKGTNAKYKNQGKHKKWQNGDQDEAQYFSRDQPRQYDDQFQQPFPDLSEQQYRNQFTGQYQPPQKDFYRQQPYTLANKPGYNPSYVNWSHKHSEDILIFLDLTKFKTQPCPLLMQHNTQPQHNPKRCFYYHDYKKDRRRALGSYTSEMCSEITSSATHYQCISQGESCLKAHNRVEEFYHPEKYKSKFCQTYPHEMENCEYGEMCAFAHSEDEITIDLLHQIEPKNSDFYIFYFKTAWCPWSQDHDKENCVYAHNWQDLRRKPQLYNYEKELCQNWEIENFIRSYSDGCQNEYRCTYSHGWKEQQYHPRNYKINPCKQHGKCKKHHCPYYHSEIDRRYPIDQNFKLLPKNRGGNYSQVNPHLSMYKDIFLNLLFTERCRAQQSIYGCGPQSVPVLDPKVLQQFQVHLGLGNTRTTSPLGVDQYHSSSTSPIRFNQAIQQQLGIKTPPMYPQQPNDFAQLDFQKFQQMRLLQEQNLAQMQMQKMQQMQQELQQMQLYNQVAQMQNQKFGVILPPNSSSSEANPKSQRDGALSGRNPKSLSNETFGPTKRHTRSRKNSELAPVDDGKSMTRMYQSDTQLKPMVNENQAQMQFIPNMGVGQMPIASIFSNSSVTQEDGAEQIQGNKSVPNFSNFNNFSLLNVNNQPQGGQETKQKSPNQESKLFQRQKSQNYDLDKPLVNHSIRSQFFSNRFSNDNMLPDEQRDEDQTPPELEKNMKNLRQSLNNLLYEAYSPDNDDFMDSKLNQKKSISALINNKKHLNNVNVMEEQDLEESSDKLSLKVDEGKYQYEDLDVDIVDNTDYDKEDGHKNWSGADEKEVIPEKKQRSFSNEFIKEEIREQLNQKQKLKKTQEKQINFSLKQDINIQQYVAYPHEHQDLLPESMLLSAQEHVRQFGYDSIPKLIDDNEPQICKVLQDSQVFTAPKLSPEIRQELIEFIQKNTNQQ